MTTIISPEISKRSKWWIPRERYYELKHFSLQYPEWVKSLREMEYVRANKVVRDGGSRQVEFYDPTGEKASKMENLQRNIDMVLASCEGADYELRNYILEAVGYGTSWNYLSTVCEIPCSRGKFYEAYRKYFWVLDKVRDV